MRYPNQEAPNVTAPQQQPSVQPQAQQINPNISMASQSTPNAVAAAPQIRPPSNTGVPPLTDHQKKIVAEFKAKIANLPPQEQSAFIAQNKVNLIKQLNFQPNQLRILQNGQSQPQASVRPQAPQMLQPHHNSDQIRPPQPVIIGCQVIQPNSIPGVPAATVNQTTHMPHSLPNQIPVEIPEPAPVRRPTIEKSKKIAWVENQLKNDQKEAVNPNYSTPFRGKNDACKRLLRYHVFDEPTMNVNDLLKSDIEFEKKSEALLSRYHSNLSKYHCLLLDESTRLCSSSSEAMLGRMWVADERAALEREKEEFKMKCNRLDELNSKESLTREEKLEQNKLAASLQQPDFPPLPETWASKYEQFMGKSWDSYKQKFRKKTSHSNSGSSQHLMQHRFEDAPIEIKREPGIDVVKKEIDVFDDNIDIESQQQMQYQSNENNVFSEGVRS